MAKTNRADNSQRCSHTSDFVNAMITLNISHLISIFSFDRWRRLDRYYYHHLKKEKTESQMGPLCQAGAELGLEPGPPPSAPALTLRKRLENTWNQGSLCLVGPQRQPNHQHSHPCPDQTDGSAECLTVWRGGNRHHFPRGNLKKAWIQQYRYCLCMTKKGRTSITQINEGREHERPTKTWRQRVQQAI